MKTLALLAVAFGLSDYAGPDELKSWQLVPREDRISNRPWFALDLPGLSDYHGVALVRPWKTKVVVVASQRRSPSRAERVKAVKVLNQHAFMKCDDWKVGERFGRISCKNGIFDALFVTETADRLTREAEAKSK